MIGGIRIQLEIPVLLSLIFVLGLVRGSTICMIACAPGIVPYLVSKKYNWRKCLQLAIIFNLPRIIILTIFGIFIGIVAYLIAQGIIESKLFPIIGNIQNIGYGLLGLFVLIFGAHMFVTSVETREDIKEEKELKNKCQKGCIIKEEKNDKNISSPKRRKLLGFIQNRFQSLQRKPNTLFFIWGGILSFACIGEIVAIEISFFSGSLGIISDSVFGAAFLGGTGMFLFAIGAAIPIIAAAVLSSSITKYFQTVEKLESIRTIGAMVMIMVGLIMIITSIGAIFYSF